MTQSNWAALREQYLASYKELSRWLARRFRSVELAQDVLHDTYLRLERGGELGPVSNPKAYLKRMAENIGLNATRSEHRLLTGAEREVLFEEMQDESPQAMRIVAASQEVAVVRAVLEVMPPRRRTIFLAAWVDDIPQPEIAKRLGLTLRRVQKESQRAREQVRQALLAERGEGAVNEVTRSEQDRNTRASHKRSDEGRIRGPRVSTK